MDYGLNKTKRSTTSIFKEENLEDKVAELEKKIYDLKKEKKEILEKYDKIKKRYTVLSKQLNSALSEIGELRNERSMEENI